MVSGVVVGRGIRAGDGLVAEAMCWVLPLRRRQIRNIRLRLTGRQKSTLRLRLALARLAEPLAGSSAGGCFLNSRYLRGER